MLKIINFLTENHKEIITKNKIILKSQNIFSKNEKYNIFTEEVNKTVLSLNDDRRIQSIDSVETYAQGTKNDDMIKQRNLKKEVINMLLYRVLAFTIHKKI